MKLTPGLENHPHQRQVGPAVDYCRCDLVAPSLYLAGQPGSSGPRSLGLCRDSPRGQRDMSFGLMEFSAKIWALLSACSQ